MFRLILFFLVCYLAFIGDVLGQNNSRLELEHADVIEYNSKTKPNYRLVGNVSFRQDNIFMTSDSAFRNKDNSNVEAFGKVCVKQGDSVTLKGRYLLYKVNLHQAHVTGKVVLTTPNMVLTTSKLEYNLKNNIASYTDSANITSEENKLTSKRGYFDSNSHDMFFKGNVQLVNPNYTLLSDSLQYNTLSKTSCFKGPSFIYVKENFIYCEDGWYKAQDQTALFTGHTYLKTQKQVLQADTMKYDRIKKTGICINHVILNDSINKVTINGDYAEYHEQRDSSFVTGHAHMMQIIDTDSLFISGFCDSRSCVLFNNEATPFMRPVVV